MVPLQSHSAAIDQHFHPNFTITGPSIAIALTETGAAGVSTHCRSAIKCRPGTTERLFAARTESACLAYLRCRIWESIASRLHYQGTKARLHFAAAEDQLPGCQLVGYYCSLGTLEADQREPNAAAAVAVAAVAIDLTMIVAARRLHQS